MTKLIPRDAAIAAMNQYWFHAQLYHHIAIDALNAIPVIDPAAIREAALREALALSLEVGLLDETAILTLIGEKK